MTKSISLVRGVFRALRIFFVASFAALFFLLPFCAAQQPGTKPPTEVISITPGYKGERQLKGSEKPAYEFSLNGGEYISAHVLCRDTTASVGGDDPAGVRVRQFTGDTDGSDDLVDIAAETSGRYRILIWSISTNPGVGTCTIDLGSPRSATEKEL